MTLHPHRRIMRHRSRTRRYWPIALSAAFYIAAFAALALQGLP